MLLQVIGRFGLEVAKQRTLLNGQFSQTHVTMGGRIRATLACAIANLANARVIQPILSIQMANVAVRIPI